MSLVFSNNTTNAHLQSHITILAQSTYYNILHKSIPLHLPSVLWHFWLGDRNGIRPVKNWAVGCWQLMPLPLTVSCFSKIQTGFTFLVPAHLDSHRKRAVKQVCVCICLYCCMSAEQWVVLSANQMLLHRLLCHWQEQLQRMSSWMKGVCRTWLAQTTVSRL